MRKNITLVAVMMSLMGSAAAASGENTASPYDPDKKNIEPLSGKVISESNRPLRDVSVTIFLQNRKEKTVQSDHDGVFGFEDLKPGTYKLVFEKDGYRKVTKDKVIVKSNSPVELNIEMGQSDLFDLAPSPLQFLLNHD